MGKQEIVDNKINEIEIVDNKINGIEIVSKTLFNQLYNKKIKKEFLAEAIEDEGTRETYTIYLIKASEWENKIKKDLYEFSTDDALDMFSNAFTSSQSTLRAFHSVCKQYCGWATTVHEYNKTGINPIEFLNFKDKIMPMLNTNALDGKYLTEEQVWELEDYSANAQDTICTIPIFYGIKGSKAHELTSLKGKDLNAITNIIKLTAHDGSTRELEISPRLMKIFVDAKNETVYKRRGLPSKGGKTTADLVLGSENIIRPTKKNGNDDVRPATIATRCKKLLEEAGYKETSIFDIYMSGKIHFLRQREKENGKLEVEDYKEVNRKFGDSEMNYSNIKFIYETVTSEEAE